MLNTKQRTTAKKEENEKEYKYTLKLQRPNVNTRWDSIYIN